MVVFFFSKLKFGSWSCVCCPRWVVIKEGWWRERKRLTLQRIPPPSVWSTESSKIELHIPLYCTSIHLFIIPAWLSQVISYFGCGMKFWLRWGRAVYFIKFLFGLAAKAGKRPAAQSFSDFSFVHLSLSHFYQSLLSVFIIFAFIMVVRYRSTNVKVSMNQRDQAA